MERLESIPLSTPELQALVGLFYESLTDLGSFQEVKVDDIPLLYRGLLAHDQHMTVTVESHHGCPVDVHVLSAQSLGDLYARKIILTRQRDNAVVLFGLVRLNLAFLPTAARHEIEKQQTPLGRVLIEHNVLRNVRLLSLWRIDPSPELCGLLQLGRPEICYGRTALIYCNGVPAVELLEIVTPDTQRAP